MCGACVVIKTWKNRGILLCGWSTFFLCIATDSNLCDGINIFSIIYVEWRKGFIDAKPYTLYLHQIYGTHFGAPRAHIHHTYTRSVKAAWWWRYGNILPIRRYRIPSMLPKSNASILYFESEPLYQNVEFNLIKNRHTYSNEILSMPCATQAKSQEKKKNWKMFVDSIWISSKPRNDEMDFDWKY